MDEQNIKEKFAVIATAVVLSVVGLAILFLLGLGFYELWGAVV